MASDNPAQQQRDKPADQATRPRSKYLKAAFCLWVILLAFFQFSENTADPDLWGHVVYGQEMLKSHAIPKAEIYSWTAKGQPWINHEVLAEIFLGGAHAWLGGSGLLLLKMAVGLLTFALCLRLGLANLKGNERLVAWGLGALAVVEISFGFPARPQIFTALCLVLELMVIRRIHAGALLWVLTLPPLFIFWINTHGGALAGVGLLGVAAGATTGQWLWAKILGRTREIDPPGKKIVLTLWLAVGLVIGALFCNPWGVGLIRFLIESVSWMRPEIEEWNPTPVSWDHGAMFMLAGLGLFAWICTRRTRAWWEPAVCAAFAVLAWRSVRNAPLFALVVLALVPVALADALARFRHHFARAEILFEHAGIQKFVSLLLIISGVGIAIATFTLHKEHPLTMEVPRTEYPVSAVDFIREHDLKGNLFVFFDWGEMTIFHLPNCQPSIDPRLDTCYSRGLIAAHWKFYKEGVCDETVINPFAADLALLPIKVKLAGVAALAHHPGWKPVYFDDTAVVLAREVERFPKLKGLSLPVQGPPSASAGRAAFANRNPRWALTE